MSDVKLDVMYTPDTTRKIVEITFMVTNNSDERVVVWIKNDNDTVVLIKREDEEKFYGLKKNAEYSIGIVEPNSEKELKTTIEFPKEDSYSFTVYLVYKYISVPPGQLIAQGGEKYVIGRTTITITYKKMWFDKLYDFISRYKYVVAIGTLAIVGAIYWYLGGRK